MAAKPVTATDMSRYALRRVTELVPVMLLLAVAVFFFIHLIPGDPATATLGANATPDAVAALRESMGLDLPLPLQLVHWFGNVMRGDLGMSVFSKMPVAELIAQRMPVTIVLAVCSLAVSLVIGIPAGIFAAVKRNSHIDYLVMGLSLLGLSIPSFFLGMLLILLFSVTLGWLPSTGYMPLSKSVFGALRFLILPSFSLGFIQAAIIARMVRSSVLETLRQDYVRTARAKGVPERAVILRHALRTALVPVVTVVSINVGILLAGAVVIETVFNLPGLGRLVIFSINNRDYPVIQAVLLFSALIYSLINLIVDLVYAYLDPRIRYD